MVSVSASLAIAAAVLVIGGVLELRDTRPAREALAALGVPAPGLVARLAGPAEIAIGALALVQGGRLAGAAVAAVYLAFVVILAVQLRRGGASCGCFGRLSTRPSLGHLAVDAALALAGVAALVADAPGLPGLVAEAPTPFDGIVLAGLLALVAGLLVAVLTVLPAARQAGRPGADPVPLFSIGGRR